MTDLSFHITDIVSNSIRARASAIRIHIEEDEKQIVIQIRDNGTGMDEETLERVRNPFFTTRTTRKVGLGIPFLMQNVEQTGGYVEISSVLGEGTTVKALFKADSIDLPPWGDLALTISLLITGNPDIDIEFSYFRHLTYSISTKEIKQVLEGIPLNHPQVSVFIQEMIRENLSDISKVSN